MTAPEIVAAFVGFVAVLAALALLELRREPADHAPDQDAEPDRPLVLRRWRDRVEPEEVA